MNRSWFRNPFSANNGSSSSSREGGGQGQGHAQAAEEDPAADAGDDVLGDITNSSWNNSKDGKRSRRRRGKAATHSDTSYTTTTSASNTYSDARSYTKSSLNGSITAQQQRRQEQSHHHEASLATSFASPSSSPHHVHAHAPSLHSISSIRTAHFQKHNNSDYHANGTDQERDSISDSNSPLGTSREVSPSKTPRSFRDSRLSWASTASGMIGFDEKDRLEAERRWAEIEELDEGEEAEAAAAAAAAKASSDDSFENYGMPNESLRQHPVEAASTMTPSRSSTSLKSILKKSTASAESTAAAGGMPEGSTPDGPSQANVQTPAAQTARTVTFSPSTLPPAPSPPITNVTPEHPRSLAEQLYLQQQEAARQAVSPPRHTYVVDESLLSSDESREVEEALLSKTSLSTTSNTPSPDDSTDSLRLQGSASKRGAGFITAMQAFIPSPDSSFAQTRHDTNYPKTGEPAPPSLSTLGPTKTVNASQDTSNLLDMSAPSHINDMTLADDRSRFRHSFIAPRPFLLRQSVILEESSTVDVSSASTASRGSTSNTAGGHPQRIASIPSSPTDFHPHPSASPNNPVSPATPIITPQRQSSHSWSATGRKQTSPPDRSVRRTEPDQSLLGTSNNVDEIDQSQRGDTREEQSVFLTPLGDKTSDEPHSGQSDLSYLAAVKREGGSDTNTALTAWADGQSQALSTTTLSPVTPSSSSNSLTNNLQDSPFSKLMSHLLTAQDDLLSHRADQKTLLLSLITNLRGEVASRDLLMDSLEMQKKKAEDKVRQLEASRELREEEIMNALRATEVAKEELSKEIDRKDAALRAEIVQERTKRQAAEAMLDGRMSSSPAMQEELDRLRDENANLQTQLENQTRMARDADARIDSIYSMEANARLQMEAKMAEMRKDYESVQEQLESAELQISKISGTAETHITSLKKRLDEERKQVAELSRQLGSTKAVLDDERIEQARKYDISLSVQEDLRMEKTSLLRTNERLMREKDEAERNLETLQEETEQILQRREERIRALEDEIFNRSTERRKLADNGCPDCSDRDQRIKYLEAEVARLREQVGKMRLESADRDVKVAKLVKAKEQLKEDVLGLNIALEAKQQEVKLLKRESHRQSADSLTASTRPHSRILKSRPSSIQAAASASNIAGNNPIHQTSRQPIDTPSVTGAILSSQAAAAAAAASLAADRPSSQVGIATMKRPTSRLSANVPSKALDAASLVRGDTDDKENIPTTDAARIEASLARKIADLPSAPRTSIMQQQSLRQRSNSIRTAATPLHA